MKQESHVLDSSFKIVEDKKVVLLLYFTVSSLRRGHANLLCIIPILTGDHYVVLYAYAYS